MKEFDRWNAVKKTLNGKRATPPKFNDREIWWCSIGVNVGHEEDGKNEAFNRPVLVVKRFNYRLFWGVPLSSQIKNNPHYHHFTFKDRDQSALLTQLRLFDASRITGNRMGRLNDREFATIKQRLSAYLM